MPVTIKATSSLHEFEKKTGKSIGRLITHNNKAILSRIEKLENTEPKKKITIESEDLHETDDKEIHSSVNLPFKITEGEVIQVVYVPPLFLMRLQSKRSIKTKRKLWRIALFYSQKKTALFR
jgi:PBP1b-binding outer membrane lipoprotein LpoB